MSYRRSHQRGDPPPIDTSLYWRDDQRAALARHDFGAVYRALIDEQGLSQRRIATLTGQTQSEVSEILAGRQVITYAVAARIMAGLGIPPELAGLSWHGPEGTGTYAGSVTVADPPEGVSADMRRRHLLAAAGVAIAGAPIKNLGELLGDLPGLPPIPAPSRVDWVHAAQVRDLTQRLGEAGRAYGADPQVSSAAAAWATRLLDAPGTDPVKRDLMAAVAGLHIHAGWAAFDAGLTDRTMYHYTRGLELAREAGDAYLQAVALAWAGLAVEEYGHPDDGLKLLQFAQVKAWDIPPDHQRFNAVEAWAVADSATALARIGDADAAHTQLARSRDLWQPRRGDTMGDLDIVAARIELGRGRLDTAEPFATASVRRWDGTSERARTQSRIVLATIHVRAGEQDGLRLAHNAVTAVTKLSSGRARRRLTPLADVLDTRPGADAADLARQARKIATARV